MTNGNKQVQSTTGADGDALVIVWDRSKNTVAFVKPLTLTEVIEAKSATSPVTPDVSISETPRATDAQLALSAPIKQKAEVAMALTAAVGGITSCYDKPSRLSIGVQSVRVPSVSWGNSQPAYVYERK